jgi:hypothetical protein
MPVDHSHSNDSAGATAKSVETDETSASGQANGEEDKKPAAASRRKDRRRDVGDSALEEDKLVAAKDRAREKAKRSDATQEDKEDERRASNRLSAYYSRKRRKEQVVDLEEQVVQLRQCNAEQAEQLGEQKTKFESIREENERLRKQMGSIDSPFEPYAAATTRSQEATPPAVASAGATASGDANQTTVPQITMQLKTLQHQQTFDQAAQKQLHLQIRQEMQESQDREQQCLDTVQLKERDDLEAQHQHDRDVLSLAHGQKLSEMFHGSGIAASNQMEVIQLMQELGEIQGRENEFESAVIRRTRRPAPDVAALGSSTAAGTGIPVGVAVSESAQSDNNNEQDLSAAEAAVNLNALRQSSVAGESDVSRKKNRDDPDTKDDRD